MKHFSMLSKKDVRVYVTCLWRDYLLIYWVFLFITSILAITRKPVSSCLGLAEVESTVCKRLHNQFL